MKTKKATAPKRVERKATPAARKATVRDFRKEQNTATKSPLAAIEKLVGNYREFFADRFNAGFIETDAQKKSHAALAKRAAEIVTTVKARRAFYHGLYPADFGIDETYKVDESADDDSED